MLQLEIRLNAVQGLWMNIMIFLKNIKYKYSNFKNG